MVNLSTTVLLATVAVCSAGELVIEDLTEDPGNCRWPSKEGDTLKMHYTGTLASNGKEFDSSIGRGPFEFELGAGRVIKGWDQGLSGMCPGDKRKLTIPPELGYGSRGAGGDIPGGATLVFEVQLVGSNHGEPYTEVPPKGPEDCGEDSKHDCKEDRNQRKLWCESTCESLAKSGECEKDPVVKQSCNFSCSLSGQLWGAARSGNLSGVNAAIVAGANPLCRNTDTFFYGDYVFGKRPALHAAALANHPSVVKALLDAGVDVNLEIYKGITPTRDASVAGSIDALHVLIEHNADVNIPDSGGRTPLISAAHENHLSIVKILVNANASLDLADGWSTALHYAAAHNFQDVALFLIEHNANVNIHSVDGETPLIAASRHGYFSIAKALINANANLDVTGGRINGTALHYAAEGNHQDIVLILMENGADSMIPNKFELIPAHLARNVGNTQLADLIDGYANPGRHQWSITLD